MIGKNVGPISLSRSCPEADVGTSKAENQATEVAPLRGSVAWLQEV